MAELVNLRTVRKRAKRLADDQAAKANRLAHGKTKNAKQLDAARQAKATHDLDSHRIATGDGR